MSEPQEPYSTVEIGGGYGEYGSAGHGYFEPAHAECDDEINRLVTRRRELETALRNLSLDNLGQCWCIANGWYGAGHTPDCQQTYAVLYGSSNADQPVIAAGDDDHDE